VATGLKVLAACALALALAGAALAAPPVTCDTTKGACWTPALQTRWQYQLEGKQRRFVDTGGINVDICMAPSTGGACVSPEALCYLSAGDIESFRPDYQAFVDFDAQCGHCLIGKPFSRTFSDEFWANINDDQGQSDFMLQMMEQRVQKCAAAGFDGIEFDVVDAYAQGQAVTGWNISYATQLDYDQRLANLAHTYGMTVALKNDLGQLTDLMPYFDYAINEQCFQFEECDNNPPPGYPAWVAAGKAVFQVEYRRSPRRFCPLANAANYNSIKKGASFNLYDRPWQPCR